MYHRYGDHTVFVNPLGAIIPRWQCGETDLLLPQGMVQTSNGLRLRGGMHGCYPVVGPPPEGSLLPQHGFFRAVTFEHEHPYAGAPTGWYAHNHTPYTSANLAGGAWTQFSVFHRIDVRIAVLHNGFRYECEVRNTSGEEAITFQFALHPYFIATKGSTWNLQIGGKPCDIRVGFQDAYTIRFGCGGDKVVSGIPAPSRGTIGMEMEGLLATDEAGVQIWSDSRAYLCLEPITPRYTLNLEEKVLMACTFIYTPP